MKYLATLAAIVVGFFVAWGSLPTSAVSPSNAEAASAIVYAFDGGNGTLGFPTCNASRIGWQTTTGSGMTFTCRNGIYGIGWY